MSIHIVTEPEYAQSTWCGMISQGIAAEAKNKKIEYFFEEGDFLSASEDLVVLIGNSPAWIQKKLQTLSAIPKGQLVLLSNTPYSFSVNSIGTDLLQSMREVISYLTFDCKRSSIALYGINGESATDLLKLRGFGNTDAVYYNNSNLHACFETFYQDIEQYDAVICANDYAAISLLQELKERNAALTEKLYLVSFSNLHAAQRYVPSITSVALDYYEYGRAAVNLYRLLLKNPQISTGNINIKSQIIPRETTRCIPFSGSCGSVNIPNAKVGSFYEDPEIRNLMLLENLLTITEETDEKLIRLLCMGYSYEQLAQELFMSVNGIKYRLNKLLEVSGIRNRKELIQLWNAYF